MSLFPFPEPLALHPQVVAEQGAQDEILFGRELVERACRNQADGLDTFRPTEIEIDGVLARLLHGVADALALQPLDGDWQITFVERVQDEVSDPFLVFINMVQEDFDLSGNPLRGHDHDI